ncbi:hypothetical protein [Microbulbifer discodermiae]|uniref:hypothetical protein n=1 Tax=Microbulbifer sp. 2201CG32-9 TaxID=3232309 RepID=UPI00345B73EA
MKITFFAFRVLKQAGCLFQQPASEWIAFLGLSFQQRCGSLPERADAQTRLSGQSNS